MHKKSTKKLKKHTKNTILSFIGLKTVQTNPLAYLLVLRLYFFLSYFKLLALIPIFGIVFVGGRLGGECFDLFQWCRDRCLEKRNLLLFILAQFQREREQIALSVLGNTVTTM